MPWWVWLLLGFLLLLGEVLTPGGFFLIFFGVGALVVGVIGSLGWVETLWGQWLLFSILSVVSLVSLRRPLLNLIQTSSNKKEIDSLIGETGTALEDLAPSAIGKIELRGAPWTARNMGESLIHSGQRCKVEKREELVLLVRKEL